MKTEWEFKYNAYGFTFTKEHKFNGEITELNCFKPLEGYPQTIYFDFRIIPENKTNHDHTKESGSIFITIPFTQEKAKPIINHLLIELNERINYQFGKFEIIGSIILGTHIPETPEEIELIGENKHFAELSFKKYIKEPEFEPDKFIELMSSPYDVDIINLFNTSKQANHPIDKFLGYFKILENRYTDNTKSAKNSLLNDELQTFLTQ